MTGAEADVGGEAGGGFLVVGVGVEVVGGEGVVEQIAQQRGEVPVAALEVFERPRDGERLVGEGAGGSTSHPLVSMMPRRTRTPPAISARTASG